MEAEDGGARTYIWCLVGNILSEGTYLDRGSEIFFSGTRQFRPGTKVYCSPFIWGDGYERIRVIGRASDNQKFISVIMDSQWIANWRRQKVYTPYILRRNEQERDSWDASEESVRIMDEMLTWLPERSLIKLTK
ncbi:hypothetical protein [Paenibacillus methanolicus]|uniref:Uncharacterized protein n=1 Tax=Paenibacillus methanolicus TaxID=582686 RepID=A0A5S5BQU9_9BACL|nr:hypothetical protein [Paenibacillus methanolicus]TYP69585.1 hypothetical protein BCM02_114101 [Paenibacillus methanolicus]